MATGNGAAPTVARTAFLEGLKAHIEEAKGALAKLDESRAALKEEQAQETAALVLRHRQRREELDKDRSEVLKFLRAMGVSDPASPPPPPPKPQRKPSGRPPTERAVTTARTIIRLADTKELFTAGDVLDELGIKRTNGTHYYSILNGLHQRGLLLKMHKDLSQRGSPDLWKVRDRDELLKLAEATNAV